MRKSYFAAVLPALAAVLFLLAGAAGAQESPSPTLKVGDKAPPLGKGEWVKGEPVKEFESGKVYVIENWATWCGPCIAAIPHVTEIQKKYADKGLVIIGQNVWENDTAAVKPFVEKMGAKMDYRVVMDEGSGQDGHMAKTWLAASGQNGIPCAFVIDQKGTIAWIGHPMQMEPIIEKVIAGSFDPKAEAAKAEKVKAIEQRLMAALQGGDTDGAMAAADEIATIQPEMAGQIAMFKFNQLAQAGKWDQAYAEAGKAVDKMDDAQGLNALAWAIVDPDSQLAKKDLNVALKAAEKANAATKGENGPILDTLARVHWLKGDKAKAVEMQQKAVDKNTDEQYAKEMKDRLEEYRKGQ